MSYISVLVTDFTISLIAFMVSACHDDPTRSATSSAFINGFLIRGMLFVVRETRLAPKMSIRFGSGNSDSGEDARGLAINRYTFGHTCA